MNDLIERQAVLDALCSTCGKGRKDCQLYPYCGDIELINAVPSAEPEQKTGEWIKTDETGWFGKCSKCGTVTDYDFPYCPYCGAKMIKDDEQGYPAGS